MSSSLPKERPLIRHSFAARAFKAVAVSFGFIFVLAVIGLAWALRTGRAADYMRQELLTLLKDECGVRAEFDALSLRALEREVVLERLRMAHEADGAKLLSVERATVSLDVLPLFYGRLEIGRVDLVRPEAELRFAGDRLENLPNCLASEGSEKNGTPAFGIRHLRVESGQFGVEVDDGTQARLSDIAFRVDPGRAGGLDLNVSLPTVRVRTGSNEIALEGLSVRGHLEGPPSRPRAVHVDAMSVVVEGISISGSGTWDFLGPVYDAKVSVRGGLDRLARVLPDLPRAVGQVSLDASIAGTMLKPRATGQVVLEGVRVGKYGAGDHTTAKFRADPSGVDLSSVEIRLGEGFVRARGRIDFDESLSINLHTETERASLARILDQSSVPGSWCNLLATGPAELVGTLRPVDLRGPFDWQIRRFVVRNVRWDSPAVARAKTFLSIGPAAIRGQWRFLEDSLSFNDAVIVGGATEVQADARIGFSSGLDISARFNNLDFVDIGPIAGLELGGIGTARAKLQGAYRDLALDGTFAFSNLTIAGRPFGRAAGVVGWDGEVALDFSGIEGRLGETPYAAAVAVTLRDEVPLGIKGRVRGGRLVDALLPFRVDGTEWGDPKAELTADFELQGPIDGLTGPLDVALTRLSIWDETFRTVRMNGRMDRGRVVADGLDLRKGRGRLVGSGSVRPSDGAVALRLRSTQLRIQDIDEVRRSAPGLHADMKANVELGGRTDALTGTVSVELDDVRAADAPVGRGRFRGSLFGRSLQFGGSVGRLQIEKARIDLLSGIPYAATIALDDMDVPSIVTALRGWRPAHGVVNLEADLEGKLLEWRRSSGEIKLNRALVTFDKLNLEAAGVAPLTLERGVLSARKLSISGPRTRLEVDGRLGKEDVNLRVSGRLDLGLAQLLHDAVQKGGGILSLDAVFGGTLDRLALVGTGKVEGGLLQLEGFEDRLNGYSADLTFSQSSILIDRSEGRWAGGRITIGGAVQLQGFAPSRAVLEIEVRDVRPRFLLETAEITTTMGGRLTLSGPLSRTSVRGELALTRTEIRPKIDWVSLVGSRPLAEVYDPNNEILDLDIALNARTPIRIRNQDADIEMTGEVRLTGTNERIGMLGTGNVRGGRMVFLGREYVMQQGLIEFRDRYRFRPRYDLRVGASACGARIGLNVVGTLQDFEIVYTSNPEMAQNDIVSCLIRGVKVSELDQDLTSFAGSALLKLSGVDREVRKVIPIDQIDVTTEYSPLTRTYEPRIVIGKNLRLLDRPARLEYSTSLLRSNDQRAALRLGLAERLNLQLGWTSSEDVPYGDWGLDLRQRWEW